MEEKKCKDGKMICHCIKCGEMYKCRKLQKVNNTIKDDSDKNEKNISRQLKSGSAESNNIREGTRYIKVKTEDYKEECNGSVESLKYSIRVRSDLTHHNQFTTKNPLFISDKNVKAILFFIYHYVSMCLLRLLNMIKICIKQNVLAKHFKVNEKTVEQFGKPLIHGIKDLVKGENREESYKNKIVKEKSRKRKGTSPKDKLESDDKTSNNGIYTTDDTIQYKNPLKEINRTLKALMPKAKNKRSSSDIAKRIIEEVKGKLDSVDKRSAWTPVNTGSFFEGLKINEADEFDIMFVASNIALTADFLQDPELEDTFCCLTLAHQDLEQHNPISLVEGKWICPKAFKAYFLKNVKEAIEDSDVLKGARRNIRIVNEEDINSPSIQIEVKGWDMISGSKIDIDLVPALEMSVWPDTAQKWKPLWISPDVVSKLRERKCYVVTKASWKEKHKRERQCLHWRLSFSLQEKTIMSHADGTLRQTSPNTCRKDIIKLLKYHLSEFKKKRESQVPLQITSYHIKTLMFHLFDKFPSDKEWHITQKKEKFKVAVETLLAHLDSEVLFHYFCPSVNLLKNIDTDERGSIIEQFKKILKNYGSQPQNEAVQQIDLQGMAE